MTKDRTILLSALLVAALTFAVYLPALRNGFVNWDDDVYIYNNPNIRSLDSQFFKKAFFDYYEVNWIPLTWTSHAVDYALWGMNPFGHHLTSNLLHAANAFFVVILAALLVNAVGDGKADSAPLRRRYHSAVVITAATTGVLFGLHPVHVESAAWIAERKDLLCAFFYLLSLIAYTQYALQGKHETRAFPRDRRYQLSLGFCLLANMSKPMAVTVPAVLLILDWFPFRRIGSPFSLRHVLLEKTPFAACSLLSTLMTVYAHIAGGGISSAQPPWIIRMAGAAWSLLAYLAKMIAPINLLPYYPYPKEATVSPTQIFAIALVVGITVVCSLLAKQRKVFLAAWLYYGATLFPVLGVLMQVGGQAMADRYAYLPSLGPFLLVGLTAARAWTRVEGTGRRSVAGKGLLVSAAVVCCCALAIGTMHQIAVWKSGVELWDRVIEREPERVPFAYNSRGLAYKERGETGRAMRDFDTAIRLDPGYANAYVSRGWILQEQGRIREAAKDFTRAIELDPGHGIAYNNRGMAYQAQGYFERALQDFNAAIAAKPAFAQAYTNRGLVYDRLGRVDLAFEDYTSAIAANPFFGNAYNNRGLLYERSGRLDEALADFNAALAADPAGIEAYNNRGLVYEDEGRFDEAIRDYTRAIELKPSDAISYYSRGVVFEKTGNRLPAMDDYRKACELGYPAACGSLRAYDDR